MNHDLPDATEAAAVLRWVPWEHPHGIELRAAQRAEITALYGEDQEPGPKPTAADIAGFVIAYDAESAQPIGCGALRDLGDGSIELKRMYVRPDRRGRRIGRQVLSELEAEALRRGVTRVRLETGPAQVEAIRLYERAGYRRIPNFGHYAGAETSLCYERNLDES